MERVYILASNFGEAKTYAKKHHNSGNEYVILNRPEQLHGIMNPKVYISPNAFLRPDYEDFMDMIRTRSFHG